MFTLDIDRLHRVITKPSSIPYERGEGQTTAMLVEALQYSEFVDEHSTIVIVAHSRDYALFLRDQFVQLAYEMYYLPTSRSRIERVVIEERDINYLFISKDDPLCRHNFEGMRIAALFTDHFVYERERDDSRSKYVNDTRRCQGDTDWTWRKS